MSRRTTASPDRFHEVNVISCDKDFVTHYVNRFRAAGAPLDDILEGFAATPPGPQTFAFAGSLMAEYGLLPENLVLPVEHETLSFDEHVAKLSRCLGDQHFREDNHLMASQLYEYSLSAAGPGTTERPLAYARRAAARQFQDTNINSLEDFRRSRQSMYPCALAHRLSERPNNAHWMLDRARLVRQNYVECLREAGRITGSVMTEEEMATLRERVSRTVTLCDNPAASGLQRLRYRRQPGGDGPSSVEQQRVADHVGVSPAVRGNAAIPALSASLEIKWSPETGRGVYATQDIIPGETVAIDEPYIGCSTFVASCCHYTGCLKPLKTPVTCDQCLMVFYCNLECLEKDSLGTHPFECLIIYSIKKLPGSASKELALKWFFHEYTRLGVDMYCSIVESLMETKMDHTTKGFDENSQFKSNSFLAAFCLESFERDIPNDVMFSLNCIAIEILTYITFTGFNIPDNRIETVGASIAHMLKVLELNCQILSICDIIPNCEIDKTAISLAYALYPSISLFNHSCDPNVRHSGPFSDRTKALKTTQYISKGDQLFISYGPIFREFDKTSRETYFNRSYFKCVCKPCVEDWPSGQLIPNETSSLNLLNLNTSGTVMSACREFLEFQKKTDPEHYYVHLNYLYSFMKFMNNNVKRPFKLYEDCLSMITRAQSIEKTLPFQFD